MKSAGTELLAPAGDMAAALAAFDAGADAVYCGLSGFSARAFAKNFSVGEISLLCRIARKRARRVYVAFNTLVEEAETESAAELLSRLEEARPDGLIVQDAGVARLCRTHFPSLALHASTQMAAHNLEGVLTLADMGFKRVVLARETPLEDVAAIVERCGGTEIECFIHGALCYSISGLCLFSAMEKERSGNRGKCAYCCRTRLGPDGAPYPFSMKDLRLGEDARRLAEVGVASLKIEGRMKSPLYVASATAYYRAILDGTEPEVSGEDLETVFSRRTTKLYLDGMTAESPVDPSRLGHLGAPAGRVKRLTRDRDGRLFLRFHTLRALEKHDGLQFGTAGDGKAPGLGITLMRNAISRRPVFEAPAGSDVEILLPEDGGTDWEKTLESGTEVYCSMSNAVKRRFPEPSLRPEDYPGDLAMDAHVVFAPGAVSATATADGASAAASAEGEFQPARTPGASFAAAQKAFSRLGGTPFAPGALRLDDPDGLFVPMGVLNDLRRQLAEKLAGALEERRRERLSAALDEEISVPEIARPREDGPKRVLKLRPGMKIPQGDWDEIVFAVPHGFAGEGLPPPSGEGGAPRIRLALPVWTREKDFGSLRRAVKSLARAGYAAWEAADWAGLGLLRKLGISDVTADWTLYAGNFRALSALASMGARRFVASPETSSGNLRALCESGFAIEALSQQSTPLFISATPPAAAPASGTGLVSFELDGLWISTRRTPRVFTPPAGVCARFDISWEAPQC